MHVDVRTLRMVYGTYVLKKTVSDHVFQLRKETNKEKSVDLTHNLTERVQLSQATLALECKPRVAGNQGGRGIKVNDGGLCYLLRKVKYK